jgi:uncharacterized membrane protein YgdD (TMEM256/DUF423 family)
MRKVWIVAAGINGLAAVMAGAAARHLWVDDGARTLADTAIRYELPHAAALLALSALPIPARKVARGLLSIAGGSLALGVTLFAGTLYALAVGASSELTLVVPVGGSLMILGWGLLLAFGVAVESGRSASAQE